jgi:hypothetical protein
MVGLVKFEKGYETDSVTTSFVSVKNEIVFMRCSTVFLYQ